MILINLLLELARARGQTFGRSTNSTTSLLVVAIGLEIVRQTGIVCSKVSRAME